MRSIELNEFKSLKAENLLIIDTRSSEVFMEGFIKKSVSVPFNENFVQALAEMVGDELSIVLIANESEQPKIERTLHTSGIGNIEGFLKGGFEAWQNSGGKYDMLIGIDADEFALDYQFDEFYLIDLRPKEAFQIERVEDAENIPLADLEQFIAELEMDDSFYVYGDTMVQAVTAGSLFRRFGFERVRVVTADFETIKASKVPFFKQKKKKNTDENSDSMNLSKN